MTGRRPIAMIAAVGFALLVTACGSTAATTPEAGFHWFPSTPVGAPVEAPVASATPTATASAAPTVGQGAANGLGTAAEKVDATADLKFNPAATAAKSGDVIQWTNSGGVPHNVTFDGQPSLTSGTLQQSDTWQVKFTTAGTYAYHCTFHPGMDGTITVSG